MKCLGCDVKGKHFKNKLCPDCEEAGITQEDIRIKVLDEAVDASYKKIEIFKQLIQDQEDRIKELKKRRDKAIKERGKK